MQAKTLLILGVFMGGIALGWQTHGWKTKAVVATGLGKQIKTATALQNASKPIIEHKIALEQATKIVYRTIKEKIYEQNNTGVCFNNDALSLWNSAIAGADSHRAEPSRAPTETNATKPEETATVEQVLVNAADNFETCNSNAIKHNALIDKVESLQGKMCVCGE